MEAKVSSFLLSLLLAYSVFQLSGCSLNFPIRDRRTFDYSAGGITSNPSKPRKVIITGDKSINIKSGTNIDVVLRSGQVTKGKYIGITPIRAEVYSDRYSEAREQNKEVALLPDLGDTVTLVISDGNQYKGDFLGLDYGAIRFMNTESKMIGTWYINVVDIIVDREGRRIELESLRLLMREGEVPFLSTIILRIKKQESRIELDDVSQIQIKARARKSDTPVLFIIGLISVGALFYLLLQAIAGGIAAAIQTIK